MLATRDPRASRVDRDRDSRADDRELGSTSHADHHRRIANQHLLRIAMHFGASYIRDADIRGPFP
jgi:hypothetical protein